MRLDVPFAFTVGNRTFPAGDYTFETLLNDAQGIEILVVRCNDRPIYHAVASNTLRGNDQQLGSKLVFNRYATVIFWRRFGEQGGSQDCDFRPQRKKSICRPIKLGTKLSWQCLNSRRLRQRRDRGSRNPDSDEA